MILLDSHIVLWLLLEPERLSAPAAKAIRECRAQQAAPSISSVSLYEIARAIHRGRIQTALAPDEFLKKIQKFLRVIPPTAPIALAAAQFPDTFPGDPMNRIIAATALTEGFPLITADQNIRRSRLVKTIC